MKIQKHFRAGVGAVLWLSMMLVASALPVGAQPRPGIRAQGRDTTGLVPVTEMGEAQYKGQAGGLYGGGQNVPPEAQAKAAQEQTALIRPLDPNGAPAEAGVIALISIGMSNTTQEFSTFKKLADADPNKSPHVVLVDCAQGGMAARQWAHPEIVIAQNRPSPWAVLDQRLQKARVEPNQVQVVWLKQAEMNPGQYGAFPAHAQTLRDNMAIILRELKIRFPNLRIAYLSSRIYAGYAGSALNPEPYAYESAFAVRWLIEDQIRGDAELNYAPARGEVKAPLLLWGPYLWANGITPRQSDGLVWNLEDLRSGWHPPKHIRPGQGGPDAAGLLPERYDCPAVVRERPAGETVKTTSVAVLLRYTFGAADVLRSRRYIGQPGAGLPWYNTSMWLWVFRGLRGESVCLK